ncbi:hypothetical protein Golob_005309 [Gossypium lobatum]|uniref:Uncharacterized protein n=1 Tax=Gossypium lobatum TaxID=34289 RepID=A0A7J8MSS5_9ROSI|nr:hypothetical protein [Gossypium lobatum]
MKLTMLELDHNNLKGNLL